MLIVFALRKSAIMAPDRCPGSRDVRSAQPRCTVLGTAYGADVLRESTGSGGIGAMTSTLRYDDAHVTRPPSAYGRPVCPGLLQRAGEGRVLDPSPTQTAPRVCG